MPLTFRERYCGRWSIPENQFEEHVLRHSLYPPARWLRGVLQLAPGYFAVDRDFIRSLASIRSRRLFEAEAREFHTDSANRLVIRRWLKLRVSAERVRRLMDDCWGGDAPAAGPARPERPRQ